MDKEIENRLLALTERNPDFVSFISGLFPELELDSWPIYHAGDMFMRLGYRDTIYVIVFFSGSFKLRNVTTDKLCPGAVNYSFKFETENPFLGESQFEELLKMADIPKSTMFRIDKKEINKMYFQVSQKKPKAVHFIADIDLYTSLPDSFTRGGAIKVGSKMDISMGARTIDTRLKEWCEDGYLTKLKQGKYKKSMPLTLK